MNKKICVLKQFMKVVEQVILFSFVLMLFGGNFESIFAAENNKELSIFTWEGYVPDSLKKEFEKKSGIKVNVTYFSDNGECIAKMRATRGVGYDLVQPAVSQINDAQRAYGIYQPIDYSKIVNIPNLIPELAQAAKETNTIDGKTYSVPYVWGTVGIVVNTQKVKKDSYSYMNLYDEKFCGHVTTRWRWFSFAGVAYAKGYDFFGAYKDEATYRKIMEEVLPFLVSKKKCIKAYWTTKQEHLDLMTSEMAWISQGWDYTGFQLTQKYPHIKFVCPKEGALAWIDTFVLSAGAKNIDAAYKWINFMLTAENGAEVFKKAGALPAVNGSLDLLSASEKRIISEAYTPEAMKNLKWYAPVVDYVNEINTEMEERLKLGR